MLISKGRRPWRTFVALLVLVAAVGLVLGVVTRRDTRPTIEEWIASGWSDQTQTLVHAVTCDVTDTVHRVCVVQYETATDRASATVDVACRPDAGCVWEARRARSQRTSR